MVLNYTVSPTCSTVPAPESKMKRNSNIGKTIAFSIFAGSALLSVPFTTSSYNSSYTGISFPSAHIEYIDSVSGKEAEYLSNSLFINLSKIENLDKLENMSHFQANWNGNGGAAFSCAAIGLFREIINNLSHQPQIAPTGRNSLLLQYELSDHSLLAFEVRENRVEMVCIPKGNYSLATSQVFTDNFVKQIETQVACFYGLKQN